MDAALEKRIVRAALRALRERDTYRGEDWETSEEAEVWKP